MSYLVSSAALSVHQSRALIFYESFALSDLMVGLSMSKVGGYSVLMWLTTNYICSNVSQYKPCKHHTFRPSVEHAKLVYL